LNDVGFDIEQQQTSFGGQYQWAICRGSPEERAPVYDAGASKSCIDDALSYGKRERLHIDQTKQLLATAGGVSGSVIWGMSTKGVVLASMVPSDWLIGGIDSNPRKQGRFAPKSGLEIHPPRWLATLPKKSKVVVMNPNYFAEIRNQVAAMGLDADVRVI
jgi:hypothetical protein